MDNVSLDKYVEISISPGFFRGAQHQRPPVVKWAEGVVKMLHGVSSRFETPYPISFPEYQTKDFIRIGKKIRVFGSEASLKELVYELATHDKFQESSVISKIKETPQSKIWVVFQRERFPNRLKLKPKLFMERLSEFEGYPQLKIQSTETKHWMIMGISKRTASLEEQKSTGSVGSYGLSHKKTPLAVPEF